MIPNASVLSRWRKSSRSNNGDGACIEVSDLFPDAVPVRDSKDPQGPALIFSANAWSAFVTSVKAGGFPAA
jgi:Domain of unknown function (DUF397)